MLLNSIPLGNTLPNFDQVKIKLEPISSPSDIFIAEYPDKLKMGTLQKVCYIVYDIFSVVFFPLGICRAIKKVLHLIAGQLIIPSQAKEPNEKLDIGRKELIEKYLGRPVMIKTPDGVLIDGIHIPSKHLSEPKKALSTSMEMEKSMKCRGYI